MSTNRPPLTEDEIAVIAQRCASARQGPWTSYLEGRDHTSGSDFIMVGEGAQRGDDIELVGATQADQEFIAHARQDIPRLLAELNRLRSKLRRYETELGSRARDPEEPK